MKIKSALLCSSLFFLSVLNVSKADEPKSSLLQGEIKASQYQAILEGRAKLLAELIQIAEKSPNLSSGGPKHLAIKLLGELRAKEAIRVLIDNLLFVPQNYSFDSGPTPNQYYYVSAMSLLKIGQNPEILPLLRHRISASKSEEERHLAAWVLREMLGEKQAIFFLSENVENSVGESKVNLVETVSYLKNFKQTFGDSNYPWTDLPPLPSRQESNSILFQETTRSKP